MTELHTEPGIWGIFTRDNAPGALPAGTRVVKVQGGADDAHPLGARGTVLGSIFHPEMRGACGNPTGIGYFVAWDDHPNIAIFAMAVKVARFEEGVTP